MNPLFKFISLLFLLAACTFAAPVDASKDYNITENVTDVTNFKAAGDLTWYVAGLGSCGVYNNGKTEDIVALGHGLMGEQSNGNPFCGRRVRISHGGKQATGTVQDKCMGCASNSIDVSEHLFQQLAPLGVGRISGVQWDFI